MTKISEQLIQLERYTWLLDNSLRSIPFNIVVAALLAMLFFYNQVPILLILSWFSAIVLISLIRWFFSKKAMKEITSFDKIRRGLIIFSSLTFITGCIWGLSYGLFLPYFHGFYEAIIILVLGGMAAGGVASLSAFMPAYYAYVLPMFLPVIVYNYSFLQFERSILATMFLMFVLMVITIARINCNLIQKVFKLNHQKDHLITQLSLSNKKLEDSNEEIRMMSITDSLTGLYNRRFFDHSFPNELNRAKRNKYPLSLVLIDVDNFKYINDTYGHPYGDKFLNFVAKILKQSIRRANDIIVRLGGDEFAAILSNMDILDVNALCDYIRAEFKKENEHSNVTLSIGIIYISPGNEDDLKKIISAADRMLYQAKEGGRNKVISQKI